LWAGVHMLIVDLFPPGPRDLQGIHKAVCDELLDNEFVLPVDKPFTLASYMGGPFPEAFLQFAGPHTTLTEMPLFLTREVYVLVPLEKTYQSAFEGMPSFWRGLLDRPQTP
jgi:hypothetical protein